jgi:hypothetical protein
MVSSIFDKGTQPPGTIARLKVSQPSVANLNTGLTGAEKQLSDIIDIGSAAQERAQKVRKLDAYLRIFNTALDYLNGRFKRYAPQFSKVEVEFIQPPKKDSLKIDV